MSTVEVETLKNTAMALPVKERATLARDLIASLDGAPELGVAEAWDEEICRRIRQLDSGEVELLDSEEVLSRVRTKIRG